MSKYDPRAFWLWMQHALGAGSSKPNRVLESWKSLEDFCAAGEEAWRLEGYFTAKEIRGLRTFSAADAQALLDYCEKIGQKVVTPDCGEYPALLRQIHNPPCALYCHGTLPDFEQEPAISIVGTRKATQTGKAAARSFAYELAKNGVVVVSGGALGIDTAAGRKNRLCTRMRDRHRLPDGQCRSAQHDCGERGADFGIPAADSGFRFQFPHSQSDYFRAFARNSGCGSRGEKRLSDHGGLCAGARPRCVCRSVWNFQPCFSRCQ